MLLMIIFNTSLETCKKIFYDIYDNLHNTELEYYPHHYDILEKKGELYNKYLEEVDKHLNLKLKLVRILLMLEMILLKKWKNMTEKHLKNILVILNDYYTSL